MESEDEELPALTVPKGEARQLLEDRIAEGREYLDIDPSTQEELESLKSQVSKWTSFNGDLLRKVFTTDRFAREYGRSSYRGIAVVHETLSQKVDEVHRDVRDEVEALESILERFVLLDGPSDTDAMEGPPVPEAATGRVFVVHGHDEAAKEQAARFIQGLGLEPVILHEQANRGRTIIEKFEDHADVEFAVILLTADDEGYPREGAKDPQPRPRQNVLFEMGYFIGTLGRARVVALHEDGVEIPSDYDGVLYEPLDDLGAWKLALAKEMQAAGMDVDLNDVV